MALNAKRKILCIAVVLLVSGAQLSLAETPVPTVSPDPVGDVPATGGDPSLTFHDYSWRSFIALNWPSLSGAENRGMPDKTKSFGDAADPRVWMTWKARHEIFQPGGLKPAIWNSFAGQNPCGGDAPNEKTTLSSFSAFSDFNQATFSLTQLSNPLVAQNRTYVRYDVRSNKSQFESIVENGWFLSKNLPEKNTAKPFKNGSIVVKAAWRILTDQDDAASRARFYVVPGAQVFDVASGKCVATDVALVGLHIVAKTAGRPQWIWSSFEYVDNVPPVAGENEATGSPLSFNNTSGPRIITPEDPPGQVSSVNPPSSNPEPMQVFRLRPLQNEVVETNKRYWALPGIKDTVWRNYMLVMTQWPTKMTPEKPENQGDPFPAKSVTLSNTTMETYFQNDIGTCMNCHHTVSNRRGRDFIMYVSIDAFEEGVSAPGDLFVTKINPDVFSKSISVSSKREFLKDLSDFAKSARLPMQ